MLQSCSQSDEKIQSRDQPARSVEESTSTTAPIQYIHHFKDRLAKAVPSVKQDEIETSHTQDLEEQAAKNEDHLIFDDFELTGSDIAVPSSTLDEDDSQDREDQMTYQSPQMPRELSQPDEMVTSSQTGALIGIDEGYLSGLSSRVTSKFPPEEAYAERLRRFHIQDTDRDNEFTV